ncbi:unnamed protein product [Trypanosoma congolense IL3000]|uniref:WGS project CAEQ00000000 data, annotated contig 1634 n=1 Tax=Trypanosoma congolense (strain IL3000) TaxID=1068625 RepID=F9W7N4_TRYCI|nr:unnamed protein product [Trypanosoma congolense IL3000]
MEGRGVRRTRYEMEGEADAADAAASHETLVRARTTWTLDSPVEEVLLCNYGGLSDMSLHDFLMEHFGETFGSSNVSMSVFVDNPSFFLQDYSSRTMIVDSMPYREYTAMNEGVKSCRDMGIFSLRQWERLGDKVDADALVKERLNAAFHSCMRSTLIMRNAPNSRELEGVYDSVFNARWSYVVRSNEYGEGTIGMGVLSVTPGEQPHLWSEAQASAPYDPVKSWEGDEVPGVRGKLVMMVLSSSKGWPCMPWHTLFDREPLMLDEFVFSRDAYIRRSNLRAWHIVKKELDRWLAHGYAGLPLNFSVIGTPGIGKSFATGSVLLYQLLRYSSYDLRVVAYFVRGEAYIFNRAEGKALNCSEDAASTTIEEMANRGIKGYIIYDFHHDHYEVWRLPQSWGVILLASWSGSDYEKWCERRKGGVVPIITDCYDNAEFKAVLTWERYVQALRGVELGSRRDTIFNDWQMLKERIHVVGPVPQYVLTTERWFIVRANQVKSAVCDLRYENLDSFLNKVEEKNMWLKKHMVRNTLIIVRTFGDGQEDWKYCISSFYIWGQIHLMVLENLSRSKFREYQLSPMEKCCASMLGEEDTQAITLLSIMNQIAAYKDCHPSVGNSSGHRTSVLTQVNALGRMPSAVSFFPRGRAIPVELGQFYRPLIHNFPVVDGFFLVDAVGKGVSLPEGAEVPTQTIVLLQVTGADFHHTTTSEVGRFRELMAQSFTNWREMENRFSYEMIYVQQADSTSITDRQRCDRSGMADDKVIEEFWNRINHFQVAFDLPITEMFEGKLFGRSVTEVCANKVSRGMQTLSMEPSYLRASLPYSGMYL